MSASAALDTAISAAGGADAVLARARLGLAPSSLVRQLKYSVAAEIPIDDETFADELVEGVIGKLSMAVLYGDSNSGKTFLAIHLGAAIERGCQWLGRNSDRGAVLYLATEAAESVRMRLKAYQRHHNVRLGAFVIVQSPINLFDGEADVTAVISLVGEVESQIGEKVVLIVGDTLARISAGANENSGEDMGVVLKNADAIRSATGATFLWVHHCGKDAARGMRGWSGMRAAIDTEIEVISDDATGVRTAEITKSRDLPGKGDRFGFRLEPVVLGTNQWGSERSSCVVVPADAPTKQAKGKRPSEIAGAIAEHLTQRGSGCLKGVLVKHFDGRYTRSAVYRELAKMVSDGRLHESAGVVALIGG